jgi:hypothetical protein
MLTFDLPSDESPPLDMAQAFEAAGTGCPRCDEAMSLAKINGVWCALCPACPWSERPLPAPPEAR